MSWLAIAGFFRSAWNWIASSRIAQGVIFVAGFLAYFKLSKWKAAKEAVREEREQAEIEAYEREAEHSGDIGEARDELKEQQEERREREQDDDPRDRFGRSPWE